MSHEPARSVPTHELIAVLQLGRRAREADRIETLGFVMVNETLQLLNYRQAMLWLPSGLAGHVSAASGVPQADANAPYIQWLNRVGRFCHQREDLAPVYTLTATDLPEELAAEWQNWMPTYGLWLTLTAHGQREGGLVFARETEWQPHEHALLAELAHSYAYAVSALAPRRHLHHRMRGWLKPGRHIIGILLALIAIATIPVRLSVVAPAEVTPQNPFLIRAPLDGVIDHFQVQPNQAVKAGTLLFNLEPTTVQSHYDLAQKAYDTAKEEYRQSAQLAVTDDKGRLEMATIKGRMDEKAVELDYSSEQLGRLQVKAARDGIVVFSDVNNWQGKAVTVGERILMLADPEHIELTVHLPAADSIALESGAPITLYPNASPTTSYTATLEQMAYRAEPTTEGVLAYRIKAHFAPHQPLPRIGQMGTATLYGERVSLVYYILRRPLTAVRQWLGW